MLPPSEVPCLRGPGRRGLSDPESGMRGLWLWAIGCNVDSFPTRLPAGLSGLASPFRSHWNVMAVLWAAPKPVATEAVKLESGGEGRNPALHPCVHPVLGYFYQPPGWTEDSAL